jgi:uncharacterized membrane protein
MPTRESASIDHTSKDPVARFLESTNWVSREVETSVQNAVRSAFESLGPAVRAALHGDWLHEPLHAVLTDVPVGSWTAAVAFDAVGAIARSRKMDAAADAAVILGLAGAAAAAVTGLNDWAEIKKKNPRRVGAAHALLNIAGTGLFLTSCVLRRKERTRANARAVAILAYLVVSLSAHLGGNLVYEHGIGVERGKHWAE